MGFLGQAAGPGTAVVLLVLRLFQWLFPWSLSKLSETPC